MEIVVSYPTIWKEFESETGADLARVFQAANPVIRFVHRPGPLAVTVDGASSEIAQAIAQGNVDGLADLANAGIPGVRILPDTRRARVDVSCSECEYWHGKGMICQRCFR